MAGQQVQASGGAQAEAAATQLGDLPEACLAQAIALTSPRDACRCAAVSPAFRAAADSDHVWRAFLPPQLDDRYRPAPVVLQPAPAAKSKKEAYLGLCEAAGAAAVDGEDGGCRVWLERATGARCYALSARRLSLPWDDGEFCWKFMPHPRSRFAEVAELVDCTCLDIYGALPAAALTPGTPYAAYFVYGTADGGHRGLSYPDQETAVAVGGRVVARHAVCLRPDEAEARKFRGGGGGGGGEEPRRPRLREDGWWEVEMGRLGEVATSAAAGEEVVASFEVLGWYPKRGLIVEGIEFRPMDVLPDDGNANVHVSRLIFSMSKQPR
ncbi:F-box protein PP2-B10-like [Panicum miliaceum]|uniref:F-box protein PP2-B10-like n=1 Tax=Panicum miliaceum TaxID=4540 RepID=A0A3L6RGQ1_PANMI|nr:F-box protein PP2-B10-like [Panicum miliaceum]